MRWTIGSQATSIPIENQMHAVIAFGIGRLVESRPKEVTDSNDNLNYPVYIDEPLAILYLRSLFGKRSSKEWITDSLSTVRNRSSLGYIFEEIVLMILLDKFGDKLTALGDIFQFPKASTMISRKVKLVSLRRGADDVVQSLPVSWTRGSSDRIGFKAENPSDVLEFFADPRGKTALFPDTHCGPDLMCFFQDEKTKELICAALQMKVHCQLKPEMWLKALESVTPVFFYTVVVHSTALNSYRHFI
jgi:hypothetical protein